MDRCAADFARPLAGCGVDDERVPSSAHRGHALEGAGPTAAFHANVTLPGESGAPRSSSASAPGTAELSGRIDSILSFSSHATRARVGVAAARRAAARGRLRVRHPGGRHRRARARRRNAPRLRPAAGGGEVGGGLEIVAPVQGRDPESSRATRDRRARRRHGRRRRRRDPRQAARRPGGGGHAAAAVGPPPRGADRRQPAAQRRRTGTGRARPASI